MGVRYARACSARSAATRWLFVGAAVPLFPAGATLAYLVMSKGLQLLLNFAPSNTVSLISIDHYLSYAMAMLLIFGASFDVPC